MTDDGTQAHLIAQTQRLLTSIADGDWEAYSNLCDPSLTAFEPEARGHLVSGMAFHRFYFELGAGNGPKNTTMSCPHVRVMGDMAVVSYVRLTQRLDAGSQPVTIPCEETRVWQRREGVWKHVHFHRSENR